MEDCEADLFALFGDARLDMRATNGETTAAGGEDLMRDAADIEAEEAALFRIWTEHRGDGVMGTELFEADHHRLYQSVVDVGSVTRIGQVALCIGEHVEELLGERKCTMSEELTCEIEDAASVGDHLNGLDAGDIVEEPAARGVHELDVALELQKLPRSDALFNSKFT